jgi:hypothetical protein
VLLLEHVGELFSNSNDGSDLFTAGTGEQSATRTISRRNGTYGMTADLFREDARIADAKVRGAVNEEGRVDDAVLLERTYRKSRDGSVQ